jgi:sialidase-1
MEPKFLRGESDIFVGTRRRLPRYLVCSMGGHFPVLAKTGPDSLAVAFRVGASHVGINGTLGVATSNDGGKSWSGPVEIAPRGEDARNPALGVNAAGEIMLAFWKAGLHVFKDTPDGPQEVGPWRGKEELGKIPGLFITRSADNGKTWTPPVPYLSKYLAYGGPYGRIISAPDGTLLMGAIGWPRDAGAAVPDTTTDVMAANPDDAAVLVRSTDGGKSWGDETMVGRGFTETSYAFLPDGTLIAAARSEKSEGFILFSRDRGRTWNPPVKVTRGCEVPMDLTVLQSGKLLLTFGRRIRPMGCGALISSDGGQSWNWDREVLLAGDGVENSDLGYPSTVQLDDGHIVTVLYYASGSEMGMDQAFGWGKVSCQAIHYRQEDIE